jgi:hypothetical protein
MGRDLTHEADKDLENGAGYGGPPPAGYRTQMIEDIIGSTSGLPS